MTLSVCQHIGAAVVLVSLLVGHSLDANANLVFAGDGGRLVVADVAVSSFGWLRFMHPKSLRRDALSFDGWGRFLATRSG